MKKVFNTENYKVMKNYMKFICAILMLLGTSAHAWGTTCTLYGGVNGNTVLGTITNGQTIPACNTNVTPYGQRANIQQVILLKLGQILCTQNIPGRHYLME